MKKTNKCAFCGKMTNYYEWELASYICPTCLGEYKKAQQKPFYYYNLQTGRYWRTAEEPKTEVK
jgi:hypothetical protein